jgi:hypothetical protein
MVEVHGEVVEAVVVEAEVVIVFLGNLHFRHTV